MTTSIGSKNPHKRRHIIAGLDIGTTKVVFVIGAMTDSGLEVIGVGRSPTSGMKQGVVVNIDATTEAIQKAKEEAELMSGVSASGAWLSIGGAHIESFDSNGMVAIKDEEVARDDINRVIEAAKAVAIPSDREVLHVLPNEYKIDGQSGISDPIGMAGVRLETNVHIVTGSKTAIQNAIKCTENTGLKVSGLVLEQLASSMAVLSEDEKELGITVVDIGGGTCDLISYVQGAVVHTAIIPVGGNNFTHDVARGLRTTQSDAEDLKKKYGCALADMAGEDETIEVEGVGGRQARTITRKNLCQVLEARSEETLHLVRGELQDANLVNRLGSGIVLTGGSSQLPGLVEMGDFIFDIPVRKGNPVKVGGLTDIVKCSSFSTSLGLLLYGYENELKQNKKLRRIKEEGISHKLNGWWATAKSAFVDSF